MRRDSPAASKIAMMRGELKVNLQMRSGFASQAADLRAESEIIATAGPSLANDLRHNRDGDFFGSLCTDIETQRRVNLVNEDRVDPVLDQPRQHRTRATTRTDHPDECAGLFQRRAHNFLIESMSPSHGDEIAVPIES